MCTCNKRVSVSPASELCSGLISTRWRLIAPLGPPGLCCGWTAADDLLAQSTEPHQPGPNSLILVMKIWSLEKGIATPSAPTFQSFHILFNQHLLVSERPWWTFSTCPAVLIPHHAPWNRSFLCAFLLSAQMALTGGRSVCMLVTGWELSEDRDNVELMFFILRLSTVPGTYRSTQWISFYVKWNAHL